MSERIEFIRTDSEETALKILNGENVTSVSGEPVTMGAEDHLLVPDDSANLLDIEEAVAALEEKIAIEYIDLVSEQTITGKKVFNDGVYITTGMPGMPAAQFVDMNIVYFTNGDITDYDNAKFIYYPNETGTIALKEEIPIDYVDLSSNQTVLGTKTFDTSILLPNAPTTPEEWTNTDTYIQRVTGKGEQEIVDGSSAEINEIKGSTVRCENLIPFPYMASNGVIGGVTYTKLADGSVKVVGTATELSVFALQVDWGHNMDEVFKVGKYYRLSHLGQGSAYIRL